MLEILLWTSMATVLIAAAGYLVGARLGLGARRSIASAAAQRERALEEAIASAEGRARAAEARESAAAGMREELEAVVAPLRDHGGAVQSAVRGVLDPFAERERIAHALSRLAAGSGLGDLPAILDAIAEAGGFVGVLLSDESGLPIASSRDAQGLEANGGVFSLVITMADRMARAGQPASTSLVVRDEDHRCTVHRIFRVDSERYLLSAATRRPSVTSEALDPALASLEATLSRRAA